MMTPWDEIVGYTCLDCGKWATHWYGDVPIRCACHYGEPGGRDEGNYMAEQAIEINTRFQKGLPLFEEEEEIEQWGEKVEFTGDEVWEYIGLPNGYQVKRKLDTEWIKRFEE